MHLRLGWRYKASTSSLYWHSTGPWGSTYHTPRSPDGKIYDVLLANVAPVASSDKKTASVAQPLNCSSLWPTVDQCVQRRHSIECYSVCAGGVSFVRQQTEARFPHLDDTVASIFRTKQLGFDLLVLVLVLVLVTRAAVAGGAWNDEIAASNVGYGGRG